MYFTVIPVKERPPVTAFSKAFLLADNWDDWFKFATLFSLVIFDSDGERHLIGTVKIGRFNLPKGAYWQADLSGSFDALNMEYFSLGQDDTYYENLNNLGEEIKRRVLTSLRDIAFDEALYDRALNEPVTETSLLRSISPATVEGQFRRISRGGARLTPYHFTYSAPKTKGSKAPPVRLSFGVEPESEPPTNVHVLIGRNGVGKTRLLRHMARSLIHSNAKRRSGEFTTDIPENAGTFEQTGHVFVHLVSVTFSAFDPFDEIAIDQADYSDIRYSYVGLHRPRTRDRKQQLPKSPRSLATEFVSSLRQCRIGAKHDRWLRIINQLGIDQLFHEAEISRLIELAEGENEDEWKKRAGDIFYLLSSGHKIVLLTITRLVETVDEKTLVLLDEPEAHLHPPLLSAFVRALSTLLIERNGVAIIATHSPVVLQEVPMNCVWKLRRHGAEMSVERPDIETFGENVSVLTREVFALEVIKSGFHTMLRRAVSEGSSYEHIDDSFDKQLGSEARAILRGLIADRDRDQG